MESRPLRNGHQRLCIPVLCIHHRVQLLSHQPSGGPQLSELGATGLGGGDDHVCDLLSCVRETSLHCSGRVRGGQEA